MPIEFPLFANCKNMKRWLILGGVIVVVVLVNVGFWYWTETDTAEDELVVTEQGIMKVGWEKFIESNVVQFDVPKDFISETSLTGIYWFEPKEKKVAIVFDRLFRDKSLTLNEQIKKNILNPQECSGQVEKGKFVIYKDCPYLSTRYTFVAIQYGDKLGIISLDHRYLDGADIQYIINSLKEY